MATNPINTELSDYTYINENYVFSLFQTAINSILNRITVTEATTWQVARMSQPTIQGLQDKTIYYDVIAKKRVGTQGNMSKLINGQWNTISHWYEEWLVQISGFKSRTMEDVAETITSTDIISILQGVFNSAPDMQVDWIGQSGLLNEPRIKLIKSFDVRIGDYETDSGLKEKMPNFDISVVVEQYLSRPTANVDSVEIDEYRV